MTVNLNMTQTQKRAEEFKPAKGEAKAKTPDTITLKKGEWVSHVVIADIKADGVDLDKNEHWQKLQSKEREDYMMKVCKEQVKTKDSKEITDFKKLKAGQQLNTAGLQTMDKAAWEADLKTYYDSKHPAAAPAPAPAPAPAAAPAPTGSIETLSQYTQKYKTDKKPDTAEEVKDLQSIKTIDGKTPQELAKNYIAYNELRAKGNQWAKDQVNAGNTKVAPLAGNQGPDLKYSKNASTSANLLADQAEFASQVFNKTLGKNHGVPAYVGEDASKIGWSSIAHFETQQKQIKAGLTDSERLSDWNYSGVPAINRQRYMAYINALDKNQDGVITWQERQDWQNLLATSTDSQKAALEQKIKKQAGEFLSEFKDKYKG